MTQAVTPGFHHAISCAAEKAKMALAQTAFAAFAVRAGDQCIGAAAAALYGDPNASVGMPGTEEPPCQRQARRCHMVEVLQAIRCEVGIAADPQKLFEPRNVGHVANKMIITHSVALLETFLEDAAKPFQNLLEPYLAKKKDGQLARSFGPKCTDLKRAGVANLSGLCGYAEADLLAQVRHVVVHRNGEADCRFLRAARASQSRLACWLRPLTAGHQVSIPMDDFILPALLGAVKFVGAAAQELQIRWASCTRQSP